MIEVLPLMGDIFSFVGSYFGSTLCVWNHSRNLSYSRIVSDTMTEGMSSD